MKKTLILLAVLTIGMYAKADLDIYVVPPISDVKILPDTSLSNSQLSNVINLTACKGEYEPASFVLNADTNINGVTVQAANLQRQGGTETIPAANIDIKVVKCWYQAGYGVGDLTHKHLTPELLLKDDSLVTVSGTDNYLKLSPDGGTPYTVKISDPDGTYYPDQTKVALHPKSSDFPVVDSSTLQPVDLISGKNKQFLVTVKVPDTAVAGVYTGNISISATGVSETITISVNVPDITLAEPCLIYSIYYRGHISSIGYISSGSKDTNQITAEMNNLVAHGITNPVIFSQGSNTLLGQLLDIRDNAGMDNETIYYLGFTIDSFSTTSELTSAVSDTIDFLDDYNVTNLYIYGIDETDLNTTQQRAQIAAVHAGGGKVYCAQNSVQAETIADLLDIAVVSYDLSRSLAYTYHNNNNKIFSYANPQTGENNPDAYRRNYGLWLWQNNYDGAMDYAYQDSVGSIWNDFDEDGSFRDLTITYPTVNGVIDTLAWEGFREGVDDVRYLTTLLNKIDAVMAGNDDNLKKIAKNAQAWVDSVKNDLRITNDLDATRSQILKYILLLNELPDGSLAGNWKFDETSGSTTAADCSGNNNNGTLSNLNENVAWVSGQSGGALAFVPSGQVNCSASSSLNEVVDYTIDVWVKPTTSGSVNRRIVHRGNMSSSGFLLQLYDNNKLYAYQSVEGSITRINISTPFPHDNAYHHIIMTFSYDGTDSTLKLYIDDVLKGSNTYTGEPDFPASTDVLTFGGGNLQGEIDELKFYTKAFSTDEIDLRGSWSFSEEIGSDYVFDESGWGNVGVLTGMNSSTDRVNGKSGNALKFEGYGSGYLECGAGDNLNVVNYTLMGWVKATTSGLINRRIAHRGNMSSNGFLLQLYSNDKLYAYQSVDNSITKILVNTPFPHDDAYHHVAMTFSYDGTDSTLKLYVDNVLKGSNTFAGTPDLPASTDILTFGGGYFQGELDELKFYGKALSAAEIDSVYNSTDLLGSWSFSESSGSVYTNDASNCGHDGKLIEFDPNEVWCTGVAGNALELTRSMGYLAIGASNSLTVTDYTIMGWIKPTVSGLQWRGVIERGNFSNDEGFYLQLWDNDKLYAYQAVGGDIYAVNISTPFPHDNTFHHFAMVFSYNGTDSTMKLYVDGILKVSRTETGAPDLPNVTEQLKIGSGFTGQMDEFKFYSRALSSSEILTEYQSF